MNLATSSRRRWLLRIAALGIGLGLSATSLAAAALKTEQADSHITIVFKQMNVPVNASFKKFNAQITYDSAHPQAAKAGATIEIGSFDLGDPEYNKEVMKKEWFNAAQFPQASFVSTAIKPLGADKLEVSGKLSIKGKTADVHFPLTVKKQGNKQVFDGSLPIKRLTYNIGEGEWKDTGMVADEVIIKFHIVAAP
jgi:polyisoprenoid-binding protein YceI